jgi:hypothetical protein
MSLPDTKFGAVRMSGGTVRGVDGRGTPCAHVVATDTTASEIAHKTASFQ